MSNEPYHKGTPEWCVWADNRIKHLNKKITAEMNDTPIDAAIQEIKTKYAAALKEIERLKNLNEKPTSSSVGHPPDLLTDETKNSLREEFPWAVALAMDATGEAYVFGGTPKKDQMFQEWLASKMKFARVRSLEGYAESVGWENSLVNLREEEGGER